MVFLNHGAKLEGGCRPFLGRRLWSPSGGDIAPGPSNFSFCGPSENLPLPATEGTEHTEEEWPFQEEEPSLSMLFVWISCCGETFFGTL